MPTTKSRMADVEITAANTRALANTLTNGIDMGSNEPVTISKHMALQLVAKLQELNGLQTQIAARGIAFGKADDLPRVEHIKSGGRYLILTDQNVKLEADWKDGTMYLNAQGGPVIIRSKQEFNDGRFQVASQNEDFIRWATSGSPLKG